MELSPSPKEDPVGSRPFIFRARAGRRFTKAEGMIGQGDPIVNAHQAIIDERYPLYRSQLMAFVASSIRSGLLERGLRRIILTAARTHGYQLEVSRLANRPGDGDRVRFVIEPDEKGAAIRASYAGFETSFDVGEGGVVPTVEAIVGQAPREIRIFSRGFESDRLLQSLDADRIHLVHQPPYRERVF